MTELEKQNARTMLLSRAFVFVGFATVMLLAREADAASAGRFFSINCICDWRLLSISPVLLALIRLAKFLWDNWAWDFLLPIELLE